MGGYDLVSSVERRPQSSEEFYENFMRIINEFRTCNFTSYVLGIPGRFSTRDIPVDDYNSFCSAVNKKL